MTQFDGGFSVKTRTTIPRTAIRDIDDLYPDRTATKAADGTYPKKDTGSTNRLSDDVPRVSYDMNKLFTWEYGDEIFGSHAQAHVGMKNYINDINQAYGAEESYKHIFIDTFTEIGPQLNKFKSKRRRK